MPNNKKEKRTDVNEYGEFGLIDHLTKDVKRYHDSSVMGIGDDAAIIKADDSYFAVTTDMLVEGVHFDLMYTPLKHLGYKSVVVNLSDIYAMNMIPTQITCSIALSNRYSVEALDELYSGIRKACEFYKVDLIGGDTTSNLKGLTISVTAVGFTKNPNKICYRKGANIGDIICVTGHLGSSYLGLQILEREKQLFLSDNSIQPDLQDSQYCIEHFLKPEAKKDSILYFDKVGLIPTSMIDISDGLSSDLFHICKQSRVGAYLEEAKIPMHPQAKEMALKFNMDPISSVLHGGEDYELLFTVSPGDLDQIRFMPGVYIIGEITSDKDGINLHSTGGNIHPLKAQGWKHF